jgi:hypothetical protein
VSVPPHFSAHGINPSRIVGSSIVWQSLDCVPDDSPCFYSAAREGPSANDMAGASDQSM